MKYCALVETLNHTLVYYIYAETEQDAAKILAREYFGNDDDQLNSSQQHSSTDASPVGECLAPSIENGILRIELFPITPAVISKSDGKLVQIFCSKEQTVNQVGDRYNSYLALRLYQIAMSLRMAKRETEALELLRIANNLVPHIPMIVLAEAQLLFDMGKNLQVIEKLTNPLTLTNSRYGEHTEAALLVGSAYCKLQLFETGAPYLLDYLHDYCGDTVDDILEEARENPKIENVLLILDKIPGFSIRN